jgi:hypothetical protein
MLTRKEPCSPIKLPSTCACNSLFWTLCACIPGQRAVQRGGCPRTTQATRYKSQTICSRAKWHNMPMIERTCLPGAGANYGDAKRCAHPSPGTGYP